MFLTKEFLGSVQMTPIDHVTAGMIGSWTIVYTVGKYGIDDTGSVKIVWRNPSDWGMPQFSNPAALGYTTVQVNGNAKVSMELEMFERPFNNSLLLRVYDGFLQEGDTITVIMGDQSQGAPGIRAQTFCEEEHEFRVYVDPYGSRRYRRLPEDICFPIYSREANEIQVVAPSYADGDGKHEMLIRAIDYYGNIAQDFEDLIQIDLLRVGEKDPVGGLQVTMTKEDGGLHRFSWNAPMTDGIYYFRAKAENTGFTSLSNAYLVGAHDKNLYFGDMHGQTSSTVGTGSLDRYFTFARDSAYIDFTGWQGNDFQVDDHKWLDVRNATKKYHEPHKFITMLGYEWSGLTPNGGDHNVYFLNDSEEFYPNSNWLLETTDVDVNNNAPTLPDLFEKVKGRDDVMIIPHIGGRYGSLAYFNPKFTPVIEIHSHHGTFEWFIFDAMKARAKVGFIATSDDHTCRPGMSYPLSKDGKASSFDVTSGYTAAYASELTREAIWEAIMARRCYATTFNRMVLDTQIGAFHMGQDMGSAPGDSMKVSVHSNSPIDRIDLYNWDTHISCVNMRPKDSKRIRIAWSGVRVRTRKKSTKWDGTLTICNGKFLDAQEYAFDRRDQGIKERSESMIRWTSNTSGDYDGLILTLDFNEDTEITFKSEQKEFTFRPAELNENIVTIPAGGENLKVELSLANEPCKDESEFLDACNVEYVFDHLPAQPGGNAYWVRILQEDGHMAWSSPIYKD